MSGKWKRVLVILLVLCLLAGTAEGISNYKGAPKTDLKFVFVHGLSGWGSYDPVNRVFPYWGLSGGSVIKYLNRQGYESYAASVSPTGSAWDRACELYAQLTGSVVDYGIEHSERCHHDRFGEDYSRKPLMKDFESSRIVLLGHSFGGVTVRLFSQILMQGAQAEIDATDPTELSPFFRGGDRERIFALITLSAPTNGTTAYDMHEDPGFDESAIEIPEKYLKAGDMVYKGTKAKKDGRIPEDYAAYDMHIDHALMINEQIETFENIYYFAYPTSSCDFLPDGSAEPVGEITESMFMKSAILMSRYEGRTQGGLVIDSSWQSNDGLVNEISAMAPFNAPSRIWTETDEVLPGIWNVMPTIRGDHMYFQGGMTKRVQIRPFYLDLAEMLASLKEG